jgi:glucose-1-phosphate cytidylyltransferase
MRTIILAGGLGTRLSEETGTRPKPMVTIGGKPMLWHIMSIYAAHGHRDFSLALGYKAEIVKEYLLNLVYFDADFTVGTSSGEVTFIGTRPSEDWSITALDTGEQTQTGGRILRAASVFDDDVFMVTYGDGVASVDIGALLEFHRSHGRLVTVTAVHPPARFGRLELDGDSVVRFGEKPQSEGGWINGGFFVVNRAALAYIDGDTAIWEREPLERLAEAGELRAFFHDGFWQPMDTLRERSILEELWSSGDAPWKVWGR